MEKFLQYFVLKCGFFTFYALFLIEGQGVMIYETPKVSNR